MPERLVGLAVAIAICLACAAIGSAFTVPQIGGWYAHLNKPPWNPPTWLFGPVWTTLFVMMGVAAWLVWLRAGFAGGRAALVLFGVQLLFNVGWSAVFFAAHSPRAAFVEICGLWLAIAATIWAFAPIDVLAAALLAPYLAWVTFAAYLNLTIARLNP